MEVKKYKLLKSLPDVKEGSVGEVKDNWLSFRIGLSRYNYPIDFIKNNTEYTTDFLFTTEDNVDIFKGDTVYVVNKEGKIFEIVAIYEKDDKSNFKRFSTREAAEKYIRHSKNRFRVGQIIANIETNELHKIDHIFGDGLYYNADEGINSKMSRKATNEEIIKYYEQEGWVKGAKFKCKGFPDTLVLEKHVINDESELMLLPENCMEPISIENCELIKEFDYREN